MNRFGKKKIVLGVCALVLASGAIVGLGIWNKYASYQKKVAALEFADIDISTIADGVYVGEEDTGVVYARVQATVEGGVLVDLQLLEHRHEHGEAAEAVVEAMLAQQRLDVDAVAGATNSSKVIRMAVERALAGMV